jgi:hypothetical protein
LGIGDYQLSKRKFRLLGFLPLFFFIAQVVHYWRINELAHMLWMCNIGNLILAIGLFTKQPTLIRVAVLWTIPGFLVWVTYVVLAWGVFFSSTLAHVGGMIVGLFALRHVGMDRASWFYALLWYLFVQLMSRLITPAEFNVNVSHQIDPGWQQTFSAYWKFWLVLTLITALLLWLIGMILRKIWSAPDSLELTPVRATNN